MNILIGCDPELFVKDFNGSLLSAHAMIPGTKKYPHHVEKGAVQVDGMALEFNIDPAYTEQMFVDNVIHVMAQMNRMIRGHFYINPVAHFGEEMIKAQPKEAVELGCDPDYNGWSKEVNTPPNVNAPFRTASGHIHVGWGEKRDMSSAMSFFEAADMACQLDFYLGLPSLLIDKDTTRKELYGKAGAFRNKPYGMEYRVLSNFWLTDPYLMGWAYRAARKGAEDMLTEKCFLPVDCGDIQNVINTNDVESAMAIIDRFAIEVPNVR